MTKLKRTEFNLSPSENELEYRKTAKTKRLLNYDWLLCTNCGADLKSATRKNLKVPEHPVLGVPFCRSCSDFYNHGEFVCDSEGEETYCRWCGQGGIMFMCSHCTCGFCVTCIRKNVGQEFYDRVRYSDDFACLICSIRPIWKMRHFMVLAARDLADFSGTLNEQRLENEVEFSKLFRQKFPMLFQTGTVLTSGEDESSEPHEKTKRKTSRRKRKIETSSSDGGESFVKYVPRMRAVKGRNSKFNRLGEERRKRLARKKTRRPEHVQISSSSEETVSESSIWKSANDDNEQCTASTASTGSPRRKEEEPSSSDENETLNNVTNRRDKLKNRDKFGEFKAHRQKLVDRKRQTDSIDAPCSTEIDPEISIPERTGSATQPPTHVPQSPVASTDALKTPKDPTTSEPFANKIRLNVSDNALNTLSDKAGDQNGGTAIDDKASDNKSEWSDGSTDIDSEINEEKRGKEVIKSLELMIEIIEATTDVTVLTLIKAKKMWEKRFTARKVRKRVDDAINLVQGTELALKYFFDEQLKPILGSPGDKD